MCNTNYVISKVVKNGIDKLAIIDINSDLRAKFFMSFSDDDSLNVCLEYVDENDNFETMNFRYQSMSWLSTDGKVSLISDIVTDYAFDGNVENKLPSFTNSELETIFEIVFKLEYGKR